MAIKDFMLDIVGNSRKIGFDDISILQTLQERYDRLLAVSLDLESKYLELKNEYDKQVNANVL